MFWLYIIHQVNKINQICYFFSWASFCWPFHFVWVSPCFSNTSPHPSRAAPPLNPQHKKTAKEPGGSSLCLSAAKRAGILERVAVTAMHKSQGQYCVSSLCTDPIYHHDSVQISQWGLIPTFNALSIWFLHDNRWVSVLRYCILHTIY